MQRIILYFIFALLIISPIGVFAEDSILAPESLSASAIFSSKAIKIEWSASATPEVGEYKIYRSESQASVGSRITIVTADSIEYTDSNISYNTTYYYRVSAEKGDIESEYSPQASAKAIVQTPINVKAADIEGQVALRVSWDSPSVGLLLWYDVYRSTSSSSNGTRVSTKQQGTEYIDKSAVNNTLYYYRIRSVETDGVRSEYSAQASGKAVAQVETFAPISVKARALSNKGAQITWSDASKYVKVLSYLVYRGSNDSDLGDLRAEVNKRSFSEYALDAGTYYYKVRAVDETGAISGSSESAKIEIKDSTQVASTLAVEDLLAEGTGKTGEIKLTWIKPSSSSFSYARIYRGIASNGGNSLVADKVKGTTFTDKKLDNGFTYYYTIRSVSASGDEGAVSREVYAAPFARSSKDSAPPVVSKIRAKDMGDGKTIRLSWINPTPYEYSYIKIYRSTVKGDIGIPIRNRLRSNYFEDMDVTASQRYFYTIKTVDANGVESENNITVRAVVTTALEGEGGSNDADGDGLPDSWERDYGFNAHLKDLIEEDYDNDGLSSYEEYQNNTDPYDPDSDSDGYSDGTEVLNQYNPIGPGRAAQVQEIAQKATQGNFAYQKGRLGSLNDETVLAKELRVLLEYEFGAGKIPNPRKHWPTLVNAYVYGGYTAQEIAHTLRYGPGLVHPSVPADVWRSSDEYKRAQLAH